MEPEPICGIYVVFPSLFLRTGLCSRNKYFGLVKEVVNPFLVAYRLATSKVSIELILCIEKIPY